MKTRLFLVSVAVSALCFGSGSAYADESLRLYGLSDVIPFNTLHTHLSLKPNLSPQQVSENQKSLVKIAQVCWIMDTGECAGLDFVDSDIGNNGGSGGSGGGDEYDKKGPEDCIKEGYKLTSCPKGYKGNKFCLYDNRYFAECIPDCPSNYVTCQSPQQGVGEVCGDGLYQDCCTPTCPSEYQYSLDEIPAGYEADGEPCMECDEGGLKIKEKYKIKEIDCSGFLDCGEMGCADGATACQSGNTTLCSECKKCPNLGTESECPPCTVCTYEECSNLYVVTGCATGCTDWCDFCAFEQ